MLGFLFTVSYKILAGVHNRIMVGVQKYKFPVSFVLLYSYRDILQDHAKLFAPNYMKCRLFGTCMSQII